MSFIDEMDPQIRKTIEECLKREKKLLELDVNERAITHKIAEYLQRSFPKFDVDCEYNRKGHDPKRLNFETVMVQSDDDDGVTVYPDIIIHCRGNKTDNYAVIEAKKNTNHDTETDLKKLKAFRSQLGYKLCYRLTLEVGPNLSDSPFELKELSQILQTRDGSTAQ